MKDTTMDNQQAKTVSLEWLGGFIDGEGCFGFQQINRDRLVNTKYEPYFKISNCDYKGFLYTLALFEENKVPYHIYEYARGGNTKQFWTIEFRGFKRMEKFCKFIRPFVFMKREEVDTILEVIRLRTLRSTHAPYSEEELTLINTLRGRRVNLDASQTTRQLLKDE
jgi:hypothetical protein